jgi:hypothetical protein
VQKGLTEKAKMMDFSNFDSEQEVDTVSIENNNKRKFHLLELTVIISFIVGEVHTKLKDTVILLFNLHLSS